MYITCLIGINDIKKAEKHIKIMEKLYPDSWMSLIILYIKCELFTEVFRLINNHNLNGQQSFKIARIFLLYGQIEYAKKYFSKCFEITNDEVILKNAKEQLSKIRRCTAKESFIEQAYDYYKRSGKDLKTGMVVHTKIGIEDSNLVDIKASKRPYLIFKIDGETVYGLPLTTNVDKMRGKDYLLYSQNYPNFDGDRRAKDRVVKFDKTNVENIYEIISDFDCENIVKKINRTFLFSEEQNIGYNQILVDEYLKKANPNIGDFVILSSKEEKQMKFYYIIGNTENEYIAIELDAHSYAVKSDKQHYISKKTLLFDVVKMTKEDQEFIENQIYNKGKTLFKQI